MRLADQGDVHPDFGVAGVVQGDVVLEVDDAVQVVLRRGGGAPQADRFAFAGLERQVHHVGDGVVAAGRVAELHLEHELRVGADLRRVDRGVVL